MARRPVELGDRAAVIAGLRAAMETPLGPLVDNVRLCDVPRSDRLDELKFELPLAGGDAPVGTVTPSAIGDVLRRAPPGRAIRSRPTRTGSSDPDLRASVRGYLTGQHRPRAAAGRARSTSSTTRRTGSPRPASR